MESQAVSSDKQSAFNMGVATLMRMDEQMKTINEITSSPDNVNLKSQVELGEALNTLYIEVNSFMDEKEFENVETAQKSISQIIELMIKKKSRIDRNSKLADQISIQLKRKNFELNILLRRIMYRHDLIMPKKSDPRKLVTA